MNIILIYLLRFTDTQPVSNCGASCVNQSWWSSASQIARWSFDGDYTDKMLAYNATPINGALITTNGYVDQGLYLNYSQSQSVLAPYIPLYMSSFTIEAWIYPAGFPNSLDHGILGLCPVAAAYNCLFLTIRITNGGRYFYFGFYSSNDLTGTAFVYIKRWVHVAIVFDSSTLTQSIYVNGYLDVSGTAITSFLASTGNFEIGRITNIESTYGTNSFQVCKNSIFSVCRRS